MELRAVGYDDARDLVDALESELRARYDDDGATLADASEFVPPHGVFYVVTDDSGRPVGCGGLRTIEPGIGEIKRMYVDPAVRGQGLSRTVLQGLLAFARGAGLRSVVLETGAKQPEAIGLYRSEGFVPIAAYGQWEPGSSLFFGRDTSAT